MKGKKYFIYSTTKLDYIEVYKGEWHKYLQNYPLIIVGFLLCAFLFGVSSFYIDSPKVCKLRSEREVIMREYGVLESEIAVFEKQMTVLNSKDDSLYRKVLGLQPLPKSIRTAGFGGNALEKNSKKISDNPSYNLTDRLNRLQSKLLVLDESMNQVIYASQKNISRMKHTPAIMPIYNKDLKGTGAGFGLRYHPILRIRRMHEGIDFYAKKGTEVFTTADGVIKKAYCSKTFGNVIIVDHGFGMETYYAHLSEFNSKTGQKVKRGEIIGFVGTTGLSSGPHLHYELHLNGKEINPVHYFYNDLSPEEYERIIEFSSNPEIFSMD